RRAVSSLSTENLVDVTMPQMGVSVAEGTVVAWRVEIGDRIEAEQAICEISTDKIDTEVPAPVTGIVAEILVDVDTTVDVGVVLARIATGDGAASAGEPPSVAPAAEAPARAAPPSGGPGENSAARGRRVLPRRAADRRRARDRPGLDPGHRPWWTRAQAGCDGVCGRQRPCPRAGRRSRAAAAHQKPVPPRSRAG